MKKLLVVLLSVLVMFSAFSICVFAEDSAKVSVEDISVKAGETVEMPVKISNNKGIWGLVFDVHFDTKAFQVKEVRSTGEVFYNSDIMIGPADFNDGYVRVVVTPGDVMNNNTKNGTICTIVLEQTDFTVATTYPFAIEYDEAAFIDVDGNELSVSCVDGSVSVVDSANKPTSVDKETTTKKQDATKNNKKLGDIIAKAEDNKLIDDYVAETEPENDVNKETAENVVQKDDSVVVDKENEETAQAIGSTGTSAVFSIYLACIVGVLVLAGIIVLVVVLVKKRKNK